MAFFLELVGGGSTNGHSGEPSIELTVGEDPSSHGGIYYVETFFCNPLEYHKVIEVPEKYLGEGEGSQPGNACTQGPDP